MSIKIGLHDSSSQVKVDVKQGTSEVTTYPSSERRLEILLRQEIADRVAGDERLQAEIDELINKGACYILIEEKSNGSIEISLLNDREEVLSTQTINLTKKIIKESVLDYENSKIIYTCNDDSTIELDISDIVNAIHQLEEDLASEIARATTAEETLDDKIDQEIQNRIDDVDAEELRATQAEQNISNALAYEVSRATTAEQTLTNNLAYEVSRATNAETQIANDLAYEVSRATGVEATLDNKIDTEIQDRINDVDSEESRAKEAERVLGVNLATETERAVNAEAALDTRINNLDLATIGESGSYIKIVGQQDGQLSATKQAFDTSMTNASNNNAPTTKNVKDYVDAETTRAVGEESRIEGKFDLAISNEQARAELAESTLQSNIEAEETRATNAETSLGNDIDAEETRAKAAESALSIAISDEETRAKGVESTLNTAIGDEVTRATGAEQALGTRIDNLDLTQVGSDGSYIKLVSQSNGLVSATKQAFDTTIDANSNDKNAPTSKSVKTYVDTYGGKIDSITINNVTQPIVNKNVEIPTVRTDINNQNLSSTQKTNAKTNLDLQNVENTGDSDTPISGGTTKFTTGGAYIELNKKVDKKTTTGDFVYTHNTSTQSEVAYTTSDTASTIVMRDANKQINVNQTPTSDSHATAKKYVDTQDSAISSALSTHTSNTSNPHSVTASQVGLGSVVNTGDSATPTQDGTTKFTTGGAYTLQTNIDSKLNYDVHIEGNSDEITYNGDTVTKTSPYRNLKTGVTGSRSEVIQLANSTTAGMMSYTDYNTIQDNKRRIDALEGTPVRLIYTASQTPTATQIKTFVDTYLASKGIINPTDSDYNSVSVKVQGTNHIWNYYANNQAYQDDGLDTVTQFTNSIAGIILGSSNDGQVYAETDGTGSVYGWSDLKTRVSNLENADISIGQDITALQNGKVDKTSSASKVYVTDGSGNQSTLTYTTSDTASTIVQRDANKQINVAITPTANSHAASKQYVDDYGGKIDTISITGTNIAVSNKNVDLPVVRTDINNQGLDATQKSNAKTNLGLATVATSGSYNDLSHKPTLEIYTSQDTGNTRIKYLEDFTYTSASASGTDTFVKSINAGSGSFTPVSKHLNITYTPGTAITGSTTQYMHWSAGSTPTRDSFTYATGNFSTAASMNFDTGESTDTPYISSVSGGSAVSKTTKYLHKSTQNVASSDHTHKATPSGSVSLGSSATTSSGAITYVESISSTGASDSGKYMHFSAGTTPKSGATPNHTSTNTGNDSGDGVSVASSDHTHSVSLTANASTATGRITYVESITSGSASGTGAGSASPNEHTHNVTVSGTTGNNSGTNFDAVKGYPNFSGGSGSFTPTTRYLSASFSGTKTNSLVTGVSVNSQGSVTTTGTITTSGTGDNYRRTLSIGASHSGTTLTVTKGDYTPAGSVTLTANESTGTGRITYIQEATHTHTGASLGTPSTASAAPGTHTHSYGSSTALTTTKNSGSAVSTISGVSYTAPTATTKYLSASTNATSSGSVKSVAAHTHTHTYDKTTSVSLTNGTAPSLTFNTTAEGGEYYVNDVSGGTTSATTKYLKASFSGNELTMPATSATAIAALTNVESKSTSSTGDIEYVEAVSGGSAVSATTKYMKFTTPILSTSTAYQITSVGSTPSLTFNTTSTNGEAYIKSVSSGSVGGSATLDNTQSSGVEYLESATHTHIGASVNTTASAVTGITSGSVTKTTKYEELKEN